MKGAREGGGKEAVSSLDPAGHPEAEWSAEDEAAVRGAVLDYYEAWFTGDATRMSRALHADLVKRSPIDGEQFDADTAKSMVDQTREGLGVERRGRSGDPEVAIRVNDVYRSIANVTVTSVPYREYIQLVRTSAGWKIVNVLWEPT